MNGLFVSREHKRLAGLRMHRANHAVVYVLAGVMIAQVFVFWEWRKTRGMREELMRRGENAGLESANLKQAEQSLVAGLGRVREAGSWSEAFARKRSLTQILGALESCVDDSVCLSEITCYNRAGHYREEDKVELEISGFVRSGGPEAFRSRLNRCFGAWDWVVSQPVRWEALDGGEGVEAFSLHVRSLPEPSPKKEGGR